MRFFYREILYFAALQSVEFAWIYWGARDTYISDNSQLIKSSLSVSMHAIINANTNSRARDTVSALIDLLDTLCMLTEIFWEKQISDRSRMFREMTKESRTILEQYVKYICVKKHRCSFRSQFPRLVTFHGWNTTIDLVFLPTTSRRQYYVKIFNFNLKIF